jgi:hypothetical protein
MEADAQLFMDAQLPAISGNQLDRDAGRLRHAARHASRISLRPTAFAVAMISSSVALVVRPSGRAAASTSPKCSAASLGFRQTANDD